MKTPISYYGGKQRLARRIVQLIPPHRLYCEPFIGGGAVFFEKPKSEVEVINDTNREVINFYRIAQQDFTSLEKEVLITLHSRDAHRRARVINQNPDMFSDIKRAWAFWTLASQSFSSIVGSSWGYDKSVKTTSRKIHNKRESFTVDYAIRLQEVQIECADALRIIESRDTPESFFYCDPPYFNSDMGHYDGYTEMDFEALLKLLSRIEGKFLLSSYPSALLERYVAENGWKQDTVESSVSVSSQKKHAKRKVEVMTRNYDL